MPSQADLRAASSLWPLRLLKLELFSDRAAGTVGETLWLATHACAYDHGNTGALRRFWPFLLEPEGELEDGINHLPGPGDPVVSGGVTLALANVDVGDGVRLAARLRESYALEGARVELSELYLDAAAHAQEYALDLSALVGDEHAVLFRGRVGQVGAIDELRVLLVCEREVPALPWLRATDAATVDPEDVGLRIPVPYGRPRHVRAVSLAVGWTTTLAEAIPAAVTGTFEVTDASGLPSSGSFTLRIGREEVTASRASLVSITVSARGLNGTGTPPHGRGEAVVEAISEIVYALGEGVSAAPALYLRNPASGLLVRLRAGDFALDLADTGYLGGASIATATFTAAQLRTLFGELFPEIALDQPATTQTQRPDGRDVVTSGLSSDEQDVSVSGGTSPVIVGLVSGTADYLRAWIPSGTFGAPSTVVVRWRWYAKQDCTTLRSTDHNQLESRFRFVGCPGRPDNTDEIDTLPRGPGGHADPPAVATTPDRYFYGAWVTPPGGTVLSDFYGTATTGARVYWQLNRPGGDDISFAETVTLDADWGFEFEIEGSVSASLAGAVVGFGLELYADLEGPEVPTGEGGGGSGKYLAASAAVIEHPADVFRHLVAARAGAVVDESSVVAAQSNLPAASVLAFDLRTLGLDLPGVLAALGHSARANVLAADAAGGTVWRLLAAEADHTFPAAGGTLDAFVAVAEESRPLGEIATRFLGHYALDPALGRGELVSDAAFGAVLRADPSASDLPTVTTGELAAAEDRWGRLDAAPEFFAAISDADTAEDVLGYLAAERSRPAALFHVRGVPPWLAASLLPGDVRSLPVPWVGTVKVRILRRRRQLAVEGVDVVCVEVL